jgi:transposase
MAKTRRTFTPEFKAEAIRLVNDQGKSLAEVARDLDLGESMLRAWKQALAKGGNHAFPGKGNPPALEEELRRLRAENKRLTVGRDILKKRRPLRQEARGRRRVRLETFLRNLAGNQSRPEGPGQPPEVSLAWRAGNRPCEA